MRHFFASSLRSLPRPFARLTVPCLCAVVGVLGMAAAPVFGQEVPGTTLVGGTVQSDQISRTAFDYLQKRDYPNAIVYLKQLIPLVKDEELSNATLDLARCYFSSRACAPAASTADQLAGKDCYQQMDAIFVRDDALWEQGKRDESIQALTAAYNAFPKLGAALLDRRANRYQEMGRLALALADVELVATKYSGEELGKWCALRAAAYQLMLNGYTPATKGSVDRVFSIIKSTSADAALAKTLTRVFGGDFTMIGDYIWGQSGEDAARQMMSAIYNDYPDFRAELLMSRVELMGRHYLYKDVLADLKLFVDSYPDDDRIALNRISIARYSSCVNGDTPESKANLELAFNAAYNPGKSAYDAKYLKYQLMDTCIEAGAVERAVALAESMITEYPHDEMSLRLKVAGWDMGASKHENAFPAV